MYVDTMREYRGRKAKIGGMMWGDEVSPKTQGSRILVCAGYCPGCNHKVGMDYQEAASFAKRFYKPARFDMKQRAARRAMRMLEKSLK